MFIIYYYD